MAVKKHELVQDPRQLDLVALANYLQQMTDPAYYLSHNELIKNCQDIVKCLARAQGHPNDMWESLQIVEDFLVRLMDSVQEEVRHEVVTAILDKFNEYISDPQSNACAATSIVLVVLSSDNEASQSTARWLVQQGEGPGGAGLRASLSCLYSWMYQWNGTPSLGDWVTSFIKALEENERFDILMEVSLDNLGHLFSSMDDPGALRQSSADAIFHVLSSLRESREAFDVISPHVDRVLTNLASDSGQFSRQLLQNIVDILTEMVSIIANSIKTSTPTLKNKYLDVILCLERHMASCGCTFLQLPPWRARSVCAEPINTCQPLRKVGLLNLGNTCYMNSIMQALLLTRQFSTHVMLQMNSAPYWAKLGAMFAKMMHSITNKMDPADFFKIFKPPFFTINSQHDSSEFLGYLFELLKSFEHCSDVNFDYTKPPVLNTSHFPSWRSVASQSSASEVDNGEPGPNRRSVSPRPGGSGSVADSSSGGHKRLSMDHYESVPLKKRGRVLDPFLRRDSYVDSMFGGVLLTRLECTECHSSFLSRDVFRDLQLAYPEKPEGWQFSVQSLLEFFCSKETLTGDNKYQCRECGVLRDAERSVLIETTPKYLVVVLKNFKFEPKLQVQTKLMHNMYHNYTITLPTVRSQAVHSAYTLYAAVVHTGTTLDSGHYYTLARDNDTWHSYNDAEVTVSTEAELNKLSRCCTPYVLFYRRNDIDEGAAVPLENLPPKLQEQVLSHNKEIVDNARLQHRIGRP